MNVRIMADSPIRFPGLFGDWAFTGSSVAFHIGGKAIYWYGIIIALGVLLALWFCMKQKEKYGITEDNLMDGVLWGIPLAIVGARLYYVLFYLDRFKKADGSFDWAESVAIWDGGLAIYGGVIAAVLVCFVLSKKRGFKLGALTDLIVMGFLIGQAVGRWGNFMNREAFGAETTLAVADATDHHRGDAGGGASYVPVREPVERSGAAADRLYRGEGTPLRR